MSKAKILKIYKNYKVSLFIKSILCAALITNYCNAQPLASVQNGLNASSFSQTLGSSVGIVCPNGYMQPASALTANCTAYNATNGFWNLSSIFSCTCTTIISVLCTRTCFYLFIYQLERVHGR